MVPELRRISVLEIRVSDAETSAREAVKDWVNQELFEVIVFSAEEGVRKPDPRIFYRTLERLGVEAGATMFIDDKADNVEGARRLGIHAIQYENLPQLLNALDCYVGTDS